MRIKLTRLILLAVSLLVLTMAFLRAKNAEHAPVAQMKKERATVSMNSPSALEQEDTTTQDSHDEPVPSEAKAKWIENALASENPEMNEKGNQLLREMVSHGSASDVLAALPKATFFSEETAREIASLQSTLCRFQDADDLAFEMIKLKFNLAFKHQAGIKPWPSICRAG